MPRLACVIDRLLRAKGKQLDMKREIGAVLVGCRSISRAWLDAIEGGVIYATTSRTCGG